MTPYLTYLRQLKNGEIPPAPPKPRKKIKPFSDKRAKLNREYAKESRPRWKGKRCEMKTPVCTGMAQGIHHPEGKETREKLLDPDNQMPSCNPCNGWVERNHAKAVKMGLKRSRLKKQ